MMGQYRCGKGAGGIHPTVEEELRGIPDRHLGVREKRRAETRVGVPKRQDAPSQGFRAPFPEREIEPGAIHEDEGPAHEKNAIVEDGPGQCNESEE